MKLVKFGSIFLLIAFSAVISLYWKFPEYFETFVTNKYAIEKSSLPVTVNLKNIPEDKFLIVKFRMRPVLITKASNDRMKQLITLNEESLNGRALSEKDSNLFVLSQASPYRGCIVEELPSGKGSWPGGFLDTCYGLVFDYAGRAISSDLHPDITSQISAYSDMEQIEYLINEKDGEIIIGQNAL